MGICFQLPANVSEQTLLAGTDLGLPKCGCGLNLFVHEGMKDISNVMVHLKTDNRNVNIAI